MVVGRHRRRRALARHNPRRNMRRHQVDAPSRAYARAVVQRVLAWWERAQVEVVVVVVVAVVSVIVGLVVAVVVDVGVDRAVEAAGPGRRRGAHAGAGQARCAGAGAASGRAYIIMYIFIGDEAVFGLPHARGITWGKGRHRSVCSGSGMSGIVHVLVEL